MEHSEATKKTADRVYAAVEVLAFPGFAVGKKLSKHSDMQIALGFVVSCLIMPVAVTAALTFTPVLCYIDRKYDVLDL